MWRVLLQNHTWAIAIWEGTDPSLAVRLAQEAEVMFRVLDCTVITQVATDVEEDQWLTVAAV